MRFKNLFLAFWVFTFVFLAGNVQAAVPTHGLWGQYTEKLSDWYYSFEEVSVENLDFDNFDGVLQSHLGQHNNAQIIWRGGIYAEKAGSYNFRFDLMNLYYSQVKMVIDGDYSHPLYKRGNQNPSKTFYLSKGWHNISITNIVGNVSDSKMKFFWTPPGEKEQIVPADKLSHKFWSDSVLTIPSDGTKQKIDYVTAGAGVHEKTKATIEIDMPNDVLTNDVWLVWFKRDGDPDKLMVKNEGTGSEKEITGINLVSAMGTAVSYPELYKKIPADLIVADANGKLKLSFKKHSSAADPEFYRGGFGIVVPFEDSSKPEGQLSIRMNGAAAYKGASPVMVFPVEEVVGVPTRTIEPLFFFADGETKVEYSTGVRPNYLVMKSGKGPQPKESDTLIKMGSKMLVPEKSAKFSIGNLDSWYPCFGREGEQFDVISSNYVQNSSVSGQYMNSNEGMIDPPSIPSDHTWVAFQYYGSNFASDMVNGGGESSSITGGGLFSTVNLAGPDEFDLDVISSGNGKVTNTVPAPEGSGINCPNDCYEKYTEGTTVKLKATPNGTSSFIGWTDDCASFGANPVCTLVMDSEKTASAQFTMPGVCGGGVGQDFCSEPKNKCLVGTPVLETYDAATKTWSWKCSSAGDLSPTCSATKDCSIIERTP